MEQVGVTWEDPAGLRSLVSSCLQKVGCTGNPKAGFGVWWQAKWCTAVLLLKWHPSILWWLVGGRGAWGDYRKFGVLVSAMGGAGGGAIFVCGCNLGPISNGS